MAESDRRQPAKPIVIIPARLASTRLPDKPLADIHGTPMIVHVWRRAIEADVGPVVVAAADTAIAEAIVSAGGEAVMTDSAHPSGSDRVFEALGRVDPDARHDAVINLQGDQPTIESASLQNVTALLSDEAVDIGTLAAVLLNDEERNDPNVVKAVVTIMPKVNCGRARNFARNVALSDQGSVYRHIGIYAYRRDALTRFVKLPPSVRERSERLEQLRALEAGMRIDVALIETASRDVDTEADLNRARTQLA